MAAGAGGWSTGSSETSGREVVTPKCQPVGLSKSISFKWPRKILSQPNPCYGNLPEAGGGSQAFGGEGEITRPSPHSGHLASL